MCSFIVQPIAMTIYSMTGYASVQRQTALGQLNLELRSVNHRFFELQVKADEVLRQSEPWIRELLASKIQRGKIECKLSLNRIKTDSTPAAIDMAALQALMAQQQQVISLIPNSSVLSVGEILRWPGVIPQVDHDQVSIEDELKQALNDLLQGLLDQRAREGSKLAEFLLKAHQELLQQLTLLPDLIASSSANHQAKLAAKLQEALNSVDSDRLQQELVYFAQRVDVQEEITRLHVHADGLISILKQGGPAGKKLDFLMQEFNREANTLASKSISHEVTQIALTLKVLIEQMREQVQNIE